MVKLFGENAFLKNTISVNMSLYAYIPTVKRYNANNP